MSATQDIVIQVGLPARDQISLVFKLNNDQSISDARLSGVGCTELLTLLKAYRGHLTGPVANLPLPPGTGHAALLLREVVLKARGEWKFPYIDDEVCHCRAVSTRTVDTAIITGCHSAKAVSQMTGAGTSCGTCRPDVEDIIKYRLGSEPKTF